VTSHNEKHGCEAAISRTHGVAILGHALKGHRLVRRDDFPPAASCQQSMSILAATLKIQVNTRVEALDLVMSMAAILLVTDCEPAETDKARVSGHRLGSAASEAVDHIATFQPSQHSGYARLHNIFPTSPMCWV
jgi:hypothetical protein